MECEEFRKLAPSYVNHQLSQEKIQEIEEHLCICEPCRNYLGKILDLPEKSVKNIEEELLKKNDKIFVYITLTIAFLLFIFLLYLLLSYKP